MPNPGVTTLTQAITKVENDASKYNNPGAIFGPNGKITYPNLTAGQAALQNQVDSMLSGNSHIYNLNMTLEQAFHAYDPDNPDPKAYGDTVAKLLGIPPTTTLGDLAANQAIFNPGAGTGHSATGEVPSDATTPAEVDLSRDATEAIPLTNNEVSSSTFNSLFPDIIVKTGLDAAPWYSDPALITGNGRLRQEVQPVTFKVYLGDNTSSFALANSTGKPVELQLNASMKSYSLSMKHLFHQQRTRTAFHITMWGMQADMIEGTCSTGVFMNQLGLTSLFSTFNASDNLKSAISGGDDLDFQALMDSISRGNPNFRENAALRVAAQDAFQELLSLFKMNGTVWLYNRPYQENVGETRDWTGIQAWSPELGITSSQINARNNDVITRGTVVMQFRNFIYEGYFKTLQWDMDAESPFSWNFSFTFQIERTVGKEFIPPPNNY